jgi:hypothetical protein
MRLFTKRQPQARELPSEPGEPGQLDGHQGAAGMREQAEKEFEDAQQALADVQATLRRLKADICFAPGAHSA